MPCTQPACVRPLTSVDGVEEKGYEKLPPLDESVAAHLCPPTAMDESGPDPAAFKELRSAMDLALRTTKTMTQAIGRSMASLVVLKRHLWLNLTEIKDVDKTPFLDSLVISAGLIGPAVDGFAERFTAAQKSS